jgi:hypothetical protein
MQIISDEQRENDLADAVVSRTHEVYAYDTNIANYRSMLETLPSEWPAHLEQYRQMEPHPAAVACPNEYLEELALVQQYDRVSALLSTEIVERTKAASILAALEGQIPAARREAALTAAIARREAALAGAGA